MAQTSKVKFTSNLFKTQIWLEGVGLLAQKELKNLQIALTDELFLFISKCMFVRDENSIPAPGEVLSRRSTYNSRYSCWL